LNAALINSVGAHIRATAIAANLCIIHILGDVPSPTMMGWVADRRSLQTAFVLPVLAMVISSAILFYGMRFAPVLRVGGGPAASPELPGASSLAE
jgi:MFS transporter, Spinster family, sphingosine-1-phosphate transporter